MRRRGQGSCAGAPGYRPKGKKGRADTWTEANPTGRWRSYAYDDLAARDKCSLDLFWLKDDSLLDAANLPEPDVIANEIADDLRNALEQIEQILGDLHGAAARPGHAAPEPKREP